MKRYVVWLSIFYILGVLLVCPLTGKFLLYAVVTGGVFIILLSVYKRQFVLPVLLCIAFVFGICTMNANLKYDKTYLPFAQGKRIICGQVTDSYLSGEYAVSVVRTESVDYKETPGRIKLYVKGGQLLDCGDSIYAVGNLSVPTAPQTKDEVDYRAYNFSRGIYANCFTQPGRVIVKEKDKSISLDRLGSVSRRSLKETIHRMYPQEEAGILTALMLGDKSGVSDDFKDIGSKVGIYHTMATSGLHVTILLTFFALILERLRFGRKAVATVNILLLIAIYIVIGYSPSISRAVIMSALMCLSYIFDRKTDSYTSLAISAAVIVAVRPYAIFDVGFLLSFASTLGIIIIYRKLPHKSGFKVGEVLLMSVCALLGTGALTAFYFGRVTLLGTLSNILIVPLAEVILPLGYIATVLGLIWFPLGDFISYMVYPLLKIYVYIAELFAGLPFSSMEVTKPAAPIVFLITLGIFALFAAIPIKGDNYDSRTIEKEFSE